jgi:hypothetical protein
MNMSRFSPYLGIVAALVLGIFIAVLFNGGKAKVSSPSPIVVSDISSTSAMTNNIAAAILAATTSVPIQKIVAKKITPPILASTEPEPPQTESTAEINAALDTSASSLRAALVNIICAVPAGSSLHSISGSGIIVDPKGIILTNAHIAEYFLLADRGVSCTIRSGSPAADRYEASLEYISPAWLNANSGVLTEPTPSGTGEHDFAFLAITKSATMKPLPSSFPYVSLATMPPVADTPVVIASYGAQFISSNQIDSDLFPTIVYGSVKEVFTFGTNTIDVLSLGGSAAAQEGSSGGGVADASDTLVGTITTSTVSGATDTRSLNAITASYIRADYASETGQPLDSLLSESPTTAVSNFAPQISKLESIITADL